MNTRRNISTHPDLTDMRPPRVALPLPSWESCKCNPIGKGDLCDCSTVCAHEARLPPSPGIVLDPLDEIQNERNGEDVVIGISEPYLSGRTVLS